MSASQVVLLAVSFVAAMIGGMIAGKIAEAVRARKHRQFEEALRIAREEALCIGRETLRARGVMDAPARPPFTDAQRMNWLADQLVTVRAHRRYGSRLLFEALSEWDEENGTTPSSIRQRIDRAIALDELERRRTAGVTLPLEGKR